MNLCPQCGREVGADAVRGLCPECLLKAGFGTVSGGPDAPHGFVPPPVGDLTPLFPRLEILELVGRGGMGAVYKARQKELDRVVALKILPPDTGRDPAFADRFAREAKALARMNHPNIVTLYEFGRAGAEGPYYFLMECVDGVNLRQLLDGGRVSPREALAIVPQICDALQYAHDHGIVHRDIKPENVLLDRQGRVKVADFGLAKIVGTIEAAGGGTIAARRAMTDAGRVMGTPPYMAPEQREHPSEVDHRADIYSLGVVFYQMLTGELPGRDLAPPSRKIAVDVRLDEVVLRALERAPERRYQTAGEVKTICETIAGRVPVDGASTAAATAPRGIVLVGRDGDRVVVLWRGVGAALALAGAVALAAGALVSVLLAGRLDPIVLALAVAGAASIVAGGVIRGRRTPIGQLTPVDAVGAADVSAGPAYAVASLLYVALLALLARTVPELPARVATHFGLEGEANGWMERSSYLVFAAVFPVALTLLFEGVSLLIRRLPARFVNLPNRDYWLAPERRATTAAMLRARLAWLSCLWVAFFGGLHVLTVEANRVTPPRLPMGGLLLVLVGFLMAMMVWVVLLLMRFAETRDRTVPPLRPGPVPGVLSAAPDLGHSTPGRRGAGPVGWVAAAHAGGLLLLFVPLIWVAPRFEVMFRDLATPLPWATQAVLDLSLFLRHGGYLLLPPAMALAGVASWLLGRQADRLGGRRLLAAWAALGLLGLAVPGIGLARVLMLPISNLVTATGAAAPAPESAPARLPLDGPVLVVSFAVLAGLVLWGILRFARTRARSAPTGFSRSGNGAIGGFRGSEAAVPPRGSMVDIRRELHTSERGTGGDAGRHPKPWAPFQSPKVREIAAHMSADERRDATRRSIFFGLWNAGTFFVPLFLLWFSSLPAPMNWIYAGAVLALGLSFYPLLRRMEREFLCSTAWAREQGIRPEDLLCRRPEGRDARGRWRPITKQVLLAVAVAMALRTWVVRPFTIRNDALAPETPAGSFVLAWLPAREFRPGDLVVYRSGDAYFAGRVNAATADGVRVSRNGVPDFLVSRGAICGRIVSVLWRGSRTSPPVSVGGGVAVVRGDGASGRRLVFRIGGRELWRCDLTNDAPFTVILQPTRSGDGMDVRVDDACGASLLTLHRNSVGAGPGWLAIRGGEFRVGPDASAVVGEFSSGGTTRDSVTLHVEPAQSTASLSPSPGAPAMPGATNLAARTGGPLAAATTGNATLAAALAALRPVLDRLDPPPTVEFPAEAPASMHVFHRPQAYTVHDRYKTGQVGAEGREAIGPGFGGFVLRVHVEPRGEVHQAVTPQTIREPYWLTDLDVTPVDGADRQLYWALSYAGATPTNILAALRAALRKLGGPR